MLRAQHLARQDARSDRGSAMLIASIVTILLFSMLGAFMTMTNLNKSATNAYIDGNNTFYAAESGLNRRASQVRDKFVGYATPSLGSTTAVAITNMSSCFPVSTTTSVTSNDFECRNYPFRYNNNAETATDRDGNIVLSDVDNNSNSVNYTAYTFASDITKCADGTTNRPCVPARTTLTTGPYTGLNAQEYKYTVYATAAKANLNNTAQLASARTVLEMSFTNQVIPIFQFGAFYAGDLEYNPSPVATFNGRIHSNSKIYLTSGSTLTIDGTITSADKIYTGNSNLPAGYAAGGQVLITKSPGVTTPLLPDNASYTATQVTPLTPYNNKVQDRTSGIRALTLPPAGFLTKTDASQSDGIGEYYGKADLRLEMFPNRSVPFGLQVIASNTGTAAGAGQCTATPFATTTGTVTTATVSTGRNDYSTAKCTALNEGQLRSLMQPILVRPTTNLEYTTFCTNTGAGTQPKTLAAVAITNTDLVVKERILDALSLTLAAQTTPVLYSSLTTSNSLSASAKAQFGALLAKIPTLSAGDISTLQGAAPAAIAALASTTTNANTTKGGCFRPAPIQALFDPGNFGTAAALGANTPTNFNNRREGRYIRMLQTNIESLTLWNRDGLFTQGTGATATQTFDNDLTTADAIASNNLAAGFTIDATTKAWSERGISSGNNVLFVKDIARTLEADGTTAIPAQSYRGMGLAAIDRTEGGLVLHATIDKTTYTYTALQSRYGFAFNDGMNLPAPLTIATDQPLYSQGDWNIFDKQPASLLADAITVLSNSCLATADTAASASDPKRLSGQLNCGKLTGLNAATATTINAAFLARTSVSGGSYGGGLNNYMTVLESWSGINMTYRGSFVSLGTPQETNGVYVTGGGTNPYGNPPNRIWAYETDFDTFSKLPPLSPRIINLKQDVFKRNY
jgi:hypothetical protein